MRSALSQYGSITTLGCPPTGVGGVISRNLPSSSAVSASGHITTNTYGDFYSAAALLVYVYTADEIARATRVLL